MEHHDNPYTTPINIGGCLHFLYSYSPNEGMAWYAVGRLHERGIKALVKTKRVGLFKTVYCVWVDIHYKTEGQWVYKPIKHFPYYDSILIPEPDQIDNELREFFKKEYDLTI